MGLMVVLAFMLRSISIAGIYGLVAAEIPVLAKPVEDPTFARFKEQTATTLDDQTPLVILTDTSFMFGTLSAFSKDLSGVRNKFMVAHQKGSPQLGKLLDDLAKWLKETPGNTEIASKRLLVLMPTAEIPAPIVIQVLAGLRRSSMFDRVILAGGLD
jgi:hypothetical protein